MNLNAYDTLDTKIDRNKTWLNVKYKTIITREVTKRKYTIILQRFNPNLNCKEYFIAFSDNEVPNQINKQTIVDNYGRIKIKVGSIWSEANLSQFVTDCNIILTCVDKQEDGEIYRIDV